MIYIQIDSFPMENCAVACSVVIDENKLPLLLATRYDSRGYG